MALCCCVSCLVTVVTGRLIEIDQFMDCRHTYTWGSGLLGNPMTLCDVICLYVKMNRNFKGCMDIVMIEYNATVDSRGLQRCADGHHSSLAHTSVRAKPIREKGRFGHVDTPVPDADWMYRCAVLFVPVGDVRIGYIKDLGLSLTHHYRVYQGGLPHAASRTDYMTRLLPTPPNTNGVPTSSRMEVKRVFTQSRPMPCKYCGKVIRCNMYRHVARLHLDLAQLWRCPVSWCTVWKPPHRTVWNICGTATMFRGYRRQPASTVRRELWTESLRLEHSGISTDIMLFSDLGLSLTHHYRVYQAAFRTDYMTWLLPTPPNTNGEPTSSPETARGTTPRSTRRSHRPFRPVRVMSEAVSELPILTIQDPIDMVGASVVDCRPPVLPVSIPLSALSPRTVENARGTSGFNPSRTEGQSIMDMDTNEITINRIVGFPWNDPGTDVEDELPTPASSPVQCTTPAVMTGES